MNAKSKSLLERIGSLMPKPKTRPVNQTSNMKEFDSQFKKAVHKKQQSTLNPPADARSKALRDKMGKTLELTNKKQKVYGVPGAK